MGPGNSAEQGMNTVSFRLLGHDLTALPSGALYWRDPQVLVVSDLHLGKSVRAARFGGAALPPYECRETLRRLADDLAGTGAQRVICLGDSFDSPGLDQCLPEEDLSHLLALQAGRDWVWITGNHDPAPVALSGAHLDVLEIDGLRFRHIDAGQVGDVSGHYHPKLRLSLRGRSLSRPCFLLDTQRLILPAYGAYTGGLWADNPALTAIMADSAEAILTGHPMGRVPMPRRALAG